MHLSIKVHNQLLDFSSPRVMGIINITPDSFYTSCDTDSEVYVSRVKKFLDEGADIIDIGACSTRPGSTPIDAEEEWKRLAPAIQTIRSHFPEAILSVDTFRADIAEKAIQLGVDIINDVYGGEADKKIWEVAAKYGVPYILSFAQKIPTSMGEYDETISYMLNWFQSRLDLLHKMGVADVIIDPAFGFEKTEQQNYAILRQMHILSTLHTPILAGISRKSMLYKPLGITPADSLYATIAANTIALEQGANILRVHDVEAAKHTIAIYSLTNK